jgi:methylisocitrate lyase
MAKLAEKAGFTGLYFGGGIGYHKVWLEASLNLTEMAHGGLELASVTELPIILDGACGWGDAMHMHRTIAMAEVAGFAAIELEGQVFPKRAGHHVGIEELVPVEHMEAKIRECVAARRNDDFLLIARTSDGKEDIQDALRRGEAYARAGADVLMFTPGPLTDPDKMRFLGERLGTPIAFLSPPGGLATIDMTTGELHSLGFKILIDAMTLTSVIYEALKGAYSELAAPVFSITSRAPADWWRSIDAMHETIDFDVLLEAETRTASI